MTIHKFSLAAMLMFGVALMASAEDTRRSASPYGQITYPGTSKKAAVEILEPVFEDKPAVNDRLPAAKPATTKPAETWYVTGKSPYGECGSCDPCKKHLHLGHRLGSKGCKGGCDSCGK